MRQIASLALALALIAAPAALAGPTCAGHAAKKACCTKAEGAADKKCDAAACKDCKDCKDCGKCTAEQKAKCCSSGDKKAEAPKPAQG